MGLLLFLYVFVMHTAVGDDDLVQLMLVWVFSEQLLVLARQDPELAHSAGIFIRYAAKIFHIIVLLSNPHRLMLPSLPCVLVFEGIKRYLHAQGLMTPTLIILSITTALNAVMGYVLIYAVGLGFIGAPLTLNLTNIANVILIMYENSM